MAQAQFGEYAEAKPAKVLGAVGISLSSILIITGKPLERSEQVNDMICCHCFFPHNTL